VGTSFLHLACEGANLTPVPQSVTPLVTAVWQETLPRSDVLFYDFYCWLFESGQLLQRINLRINKWKSQGVLRDRIINSYD